MGYLTLKNGIKIKLQRGKAMISSKEQTFSEKILPIIFGDILTMFYLSQLTSHSNFFASVNSPYRNLL